MRTLRSHLQSIKNKELKTKRHYAFCKTISWIGFAIMFCGIMMIFIELSYPFIYNSPMNTMPSFQIEQQHISSNRLLKSNSESNESYSTYTCVGDIFHKVATNRLISCHFTNICFDTNTENWTYYSRNIDENKSAKDIIYDNLGELLDDFWDKFILFRHNPPTYWRPYIKYKPAPKTKQDLNTTKWFTNPTVYHYPYVMDNFGHCLGDNFYTIWHLIDIFSQYSYKNMQLLLHYDSLLSYNSTINNIKNIYPYLMEQIPLVLYKHNSEKTLTTFIENEENMKYNQQLQHYKTFCFKDVYIGTTNIRLQRSNAKPYEWNRFIYNQFLNNDKHYEIYNKYMQYPKQKILFLNKTLGWHRRRYANDIAKVCEYISNLFGIEINILSDADLIEMNLEEQINLLLEYTILITPCGSLAFSGVFMKEGSAMITMDWYNQRVNSSTHLESYIWEFETRKKTYYYHVTENDVVKYFDDEFIKRKRISLHDVDLHWSDYIIRPKRLATYVNAALIWVENYNGWQNTYTKPQNTWLDSTDVLNQ